MRQAIYIAQAMEKHAIRAGEGITWITRAYTPRIGRYSLQPLDHHLYGGSCGVALFLATLSMLTEEVHYRQLALATLQPLRQALGDLHSARQPLDIGGAIGYGSWVYALTRTGLWLEDDALLDDARRAAALVTPERLAADHHLDVISGAAGAILALLALYNACADPSLLEKAVACGQHLLDARVASQPGQRSWPDRDGKLLAGFSHGAAGIAYALLRLHSASGEHAFREAAREAIAYEDSLFDPKAGNWPDLRTSMPQAPSFMTSWCHGAPGIGLARLGGLASLDTQGIQADIRIALKTCLESAPSNTDYLCCGILGCVELLVEAARRLARPELLETALRWTGWMVERAERAGSYALGLSPQQAWQFAPGLFQGNAGVGYELLRLAYPAQVPSVLLWE